MCSSKRSVTISAIAILALMAARPAGASAQSWAFLDGLGYGAAGAGLRLLAGWEADCADYVCMETMGRTLGGLAAGGIIGGVMGRRADRLVERGDPVGGSHRAGVAAGAVLAGAAMGGIGSFLLINGEGSGTFLGSDEQTFSGLVLAGAAVGVLIAGSRWDDLTGAAGSRVAVRPTVLHRDRPGLVARWRF